MMHNINKENCEHILYRAMEQACQHDDKSDEFDSFALSYYADALRYLAKKGYIKITHQYARRVIAVPTKKGKAVDKIEDERFKKVFKIMEKAFNKNKLKDDLKEGMKK